MRQFLITESPLKILKNTFYFYLKSSFRSQDIQVFVMTLWSSRKNGSIRKVNFKISNFTTWINKQLQYTYCPISQDVKVTMQ